MSFWCTHLAAFADDALKDEEGYAICSCGETIYVGPLRPRDLWDAFDAICRQAGYPSYEAMRLELELRANEHEAQTKRPRQSGETKG
jgi:hypothetical protein